MGNGSAKHEQPARAVLFYVPFGDLDVLRAFMMRRDALRDADMDRLVAVNAVSDPELARSFGIEAFPTLVLEHANAAPTRMPVTPASMLELDDWVRAAVPQTFTE